MGWGPSRVRDVSSNVFRISLSYSCDFQEFLFYHQKEPEMIEDPNNPSTPWVQMIRLELGSPFFFLALTLFIYSMYPSPRSRNMSDSERLIKQTYSVHVSLPADRPQGVTRKWHISMYFFPLALQLAI